jgi:hypothetical protein
VVVVFESSKAGTDSHSSYASGADSVGIDCKEQSIVATTAVADTANTLGIDVDFIEHQILVHRFAELRASNKT